MIGAPNSAFVRIGNDSNAMGSDAPPMDQLGQIGGRVSDPTNEYLDNLDRKQQALRELGEAPIQKDFTDSSNDSTFYVAPNRRYSYGFIWLNGSMLGYNPFRYLYDNAYGSMFGYKDDTDTSVNGSLDTGDNGRLNPGDSPADSLQSRKDALNVITRDFPVCAGAIVREVGLIPLEVMQEIELAKFLKTAAGAGYRLIKEGGKRIIKKMVKGELKSLSDSEG
jgi:hypothetical protein